MRTIYVKFNNSAKDLEVLGKVIRKYIDWNGSLPHIPSDYRIIRMSFHPDKTKKGKKIIKLEMEIGRI